MSDVNMVDRFEAKEFGIRLSRTILLLCIKVVFALVVIVSACKAGSLCFLVFNHPFCCSLIHSIQPI